MIAARGKEVHEADQRTEGGTRRRKEKMERIGNRKK